MKEALDFIFSGILEDARNDLKNMKKEDLDYNFWFFKYDKGASDLINLYSFIEMLELYKRKCRMWEEIHNGHACVVERVRDTYLLPKVQEFLDNMKAV